ncbi:winged helix-turn-helix domain-containing protein [uncultured Caldilinea sp.]|uniref:winged helix-turn-helix domain-containing protein n=1 Tax=Caldilinea sp. TaxID=2293560 RepID=UPI003415012F
MKDLARLVERDYAVVYDSPTSYRTLRKRCGLSRQRPAKQCKSRSKLKVLSFEETLEKTDGHGPRGVQIVRHQRGQTLIVKVDPSRKSVHF